MSSSPRENLTPQPRSQDALAKAFDALLQPGDTLLCEAPTYSGSLAYLQPLGCDLQGVACDAHGMIPADLRRQLEEWDEVSYT